MSLNSARLLKVASNGQISIGKKWADREIRIEEVSEHELRIVAGVFIPKDQAMFFTPKALDTLRDFKQWAEKNPPKQSNLSQLRAQREKAKAKTRKA